MWKIALLFFIVIFGLVFINYVANKTIGVDVNKKTDKSNFSISKAEAKKIAEWRFSKSIQEDDPVFKSWERSTLGDPVLVRTVEEEPSYWTVPVIFKEKVVGFIDIGNKLIKRYGIFGCGTPDNLSACPSVITFITPEEAVELAKNITDSYPDAKISAPIFVHDDEKSSVAWMLKVEKNGKIISRVFVAGNIVYERKEGELIKNVGGIIIAFEENTSKNEVESILNNYNLILPYELNYNITWTGPFFYITVPDDYFEKIKNNLKGKAFYPLKTSKKSNGQSIVIMDSSLPEKELIKELSPIAESYNLQLKSFVWVYIYYKGSDISLDDGNTLKESLGKNEKVIIASLVTSKG